METENAVVVILPNEVQELAVKVSADKQKEVSNVLTQIFTGTADWKQQADSIVVKDINDKMSIQMADAGRRNVKTARLAAEKIFDAKRDEVQQIKAEYDLEDKLWLKAKQTMQLLFKDVENTFEYKAKFAERYEAEQKELRTQNQIEKVKPFAELNRFEFENMSEEMFTIFLTGTEKSYDDWIEAEQKAEDERIEQGRILQLYAERKEAIMDLWPYVLPEDKHANLGHLDDQGWAIFTQNLNNAKLKKEAEQKRINQENVRLQEENKKQAARIEAEILFQKEQQAKADQERKEIEEKARKEAEIRERRNAELRPYIVLIRDYSKMLNHSESEYQKELANLKVAYKLEREYEESERLKKIDIETKQIEEYQKAESERVKLSAELQAKKDAELKYQQEYDRKEKERKQAEEKESKAPDKIKMTKWIDSLNIAVPELSNLNAMATANVISQKFEAFKVWAKQQIETL
jgi:hypothetical protein